MPSFESGVGISFQYSIHLLSQYFPPPGASFVGGWQRLCFLRAERTREHGKTIFSDRPRHCDCPAIPWRWEILTGLELSKVLPNRRGYKNGYREYALTDLIAQCHEQALMLLRRNLIPAGLIAASVKISPETRKYHCIFARDVGISTLGMVVCGDQELLAGACQSLRTLAKHQAANGQIPKFVDPYKELGDFWYMGCIDATLWWLLAIDFVSCHTAIDLRAEFAEKITAAITWLQCQEHPHLYLLQQNEASDWADIMPRSGFVLYTNALWFQVKRSFKLPKLKETRYHFNHLFHPFASDLPEYQRLRLLMHFVRRKLLIANFI